MPQYGGIHREAALAAAMVQRRTGRKGHREGTHRVCKTVQFHAKSTPSNRFRQHVDLPPTSKSKVKFNHDYNNRVVNMMPILFSLIRQISYLITLAYSNTPRLT